MDRLLVNEARLADAARPLSGCVPAHWTPQDVLRAHPPCSRLVDRLTASWAPDQLSATMRKQHRATLTEPLWIVPLDDRLQPIEQLVQGRARDLSLTGASFCHQAVIFTKHVALSFSSDPLCIPWIVTRLKWTHFRTDGTYVSGGVFISTVWLNSGLLRSNHPTETVSTA